MSTLQYRNIRRKLGLVMAGFAVATSPLAARASSIGLYTDESGSSCSFSGNESGVITAYVMIRPDERGLHGVRFSAPIPSCLGAIFVEELKPLGAETIGDSQSGISVAFGTCATTPRVALQINYYRSGSTAACCAFPIAADPYVGMIEGVSCQHQSFTVDPVVSHFNANASCACTQAANEPPAVPSNPVPSNNKLDAPAWAELRWRSSDPEGEHVTYDVYLGTEQDPPLVAANVWDSPYDAGLLVDQTQYYWRVVARDPHGREAEGPLWTFRTIANVPPFTPSDPSPSMGASGLSSNIILRWTCSDPAGEDLTFDVYFGNSDSLSLVATDITPTTFNPGPLAPATYYRWSITARDPHGNETRSPIWLFSTIAVANFSVVPGSEGVNVTWQLLSSEGMQSYTLYRSGQYGSPVAVSEGDVSGATGSYLDTNVQPNSNYRYDLALLSDEGEEFHSSTASVNTSVLSLELGPNQPNPFNPQTTIPYQLRVGGHVRLVIYDSAGRLVRTLVDGRQNDGFYDVVWDGTNHSGAVVSSGVYFCVLKINEDRRTRKLVLMK